MATFFQTSDLTSTLDNTTLFNLASGDELFIGREATVATTGSNSRPVSATDNTRMIINGELFGASNAISTSGDDNSISIGAEGSVNSTGSAIVLDGVDDTVSNAGAIEGTAAGLVSVFGSTSVTNTGLISGATAIRMVTGSNEIVNHGTIKSEFAGNNAIFIDGGGNNVENTGTISAVEGPAIEFANGAGFGNDVFNSGTILTAGGSGSFGRDAIEFADANDELVNTGLVAGEIDFGAGDDFLDTRQGTVTGDVFGDDGEDTMLGSAGDDDFGGGDDNDFLLGFAGDDELSGGNGNDVLNGGLGLDALDGDAGFDSASYAGSSESVVAFLAAPHLNRGAEAEGDTYSEIEGLIGSRFADRLTGTSGDDSLNGNAGADVLVGGAGDDLYTVDLATDKIVESAAASGGVDTVRSSTSLTLATGLENLELLFNPADVAVNGTGNAGANRITGSSEANILNGGLGQDTLIGGGGADAFLFDTALSAANRDTIEDFNVFADTIRIDNAVFTGLAAGGLAAGAFTIGAAASQADDRIVYNDVTGALSFDANGSAGGGAVQFATLDPGLALTSGDFLVV